MTRILHVIPELTGGGAERQLTLLAAAQSARGHHVHIAVLRGETPVDLAKSGVKVHVLRVSSHVDPRIIWRYRSLIRDTRAEIVQTWLTMPDVTAGVAAVMTDTPWVLSERSMARQYPPNWKNNARAHMAKNAGAIVANSRAGVEYWLSRGIPNERLVEIPNAVDVASLGDEVRPALPSAWEHRPIVMFAGRLSEEKNPFVMVDALAQALRGTPAIALLCGAGPLQPEVARRIETLGASEFIVMLGVRQDVYALLKRAQLCVAVSRHEGSPNVVLEAIAAECPLVVSDISAYRQLLSDETARFAPVDDIAAIAQAIIEMLGDPEAAHRRAVLARARSRTLSPNDAAVELDTVYRKLLRS
ncbi:MAG: glycosyltransferase [Gemmatimonadaceae bacterium]